MRARLRWLSVPRLLWSAASPAPRRRLHHCRATAAASRHAAPPAPRRDQARRHTASSTAASPGPARPPAIGRTGRSTRPQGADCRFAEPHARSSCPLARASASRWACTLLAQTTNCGPTFRARARRGAPPRRAAAPEEKIGPGGAQGEPDSPRRSTPKCSTGKTFFVGNLAKRVKPVSDHADHEVF